MGRIDLQSTRTSDTAPATPEAAAEKPSSSKNSTEQQREFALQRTEVLPAWGQDAATVSFSREHERMLARLDHAASLRRLQGAGAIGLCLWLSVLPLDALVIAQPSLLLGDRTSLGQPLRRGEHLASLADRWLRPLLPARLRGISAEDVAAALAKAVPHATGQVVLDSARMQGAAAA